MTTVLQPGQRPNIQIGKDVHPEVARHIQTLYQMIYDSAQAPVSLQDTLVGGAVATATIAAAAITAVTVTAQGYYRTAPTVTITGDGAGASAKAVMDASGRRVVSVTVLHGGAGYTHAQVNFTP